MLNTVLGISVKFN